MEAINEFFNGMNALTLIFVSLLVFAIAYRFYGIFLANKVLKLDANRVTPAVKYADGKDYVPTNKYVLFGHHFAAIAAAGPLVGPVLAAQFGFLPGALWILIGCVLGGAVHDMVVLFASIRHKAQSLATIAGKEIGPVTGVVAGFGVLFILILTLAGLSIACRNAMHEAPWSLFIVAITIPIAIIMGIIMRVQKGVALASIVGLVLLVGGIIAGHSLTFVPLDLREMIALGGKLASLPADQLATFDFKNYAFMTPDLINLAHQGDWAQVVTQFNLGDKYSYMTPELIDSLKQGAMTIKDLPMIAGGFGYYFDWSLNALGVGIPAYGFIASVLPVWFLLVPRDYLSTYLKIGTIAMLAIGICFVRPEMVMPALTQFTGGGGPVIGGPVIPFIFITIACGAVSGFHAIIGTGTTPKMISNEREVLFVGYGAMLTEGFVAIMALIAACTLIPGDYFAINTPQGAAYDAFKAAAPHLASLDVLNAYSQEIGINLMHRPGGAVSLAVGMAHIFHKIPYMDHLIAYWYNFAVMFEAVFILTAIDAGTRVGRFFLQELLGHVAPKFNDKDWMPGVIVSSAIFTFLWGYLLYTGNIGSIWPLFGMSNQLLAACALIVSTTMLLRLNRGKLALLTAIPGLFMAFITFWAGYLQVTTVYLPKNQMLLAVLACIVMVLMIIIFIGAFRKWAELMSIKTTIKDEYGDDVRQLAEE